MNDFLMFRSMISPWFIRVWFAFCAFIVGLSFLGTIGFGVLLFLGMGGAVVTDDTFTAGGAAIGVGASGFTVLFTILPLLVMLVLGLLWLRLMFEGAILMFQMNETLSKIAVTMERLSQAPGSPSKSVPDGTQEPMFTFGQS